MQTLALEIIIALNECMGRLSRSPHGTNTTGVVYKQGKGKVQGLPQSQAAAHPRHQEEEETDKKR